MYESYYSCMIYISLRNKQTLFHLTHRSEQCYKQLFTLCTQNYFTYEYADLSKKIQILEDVNFVETSSKRTF